MKTRTWGILFSLLAVAGGLARQDRTVCGTTRDKLKEELHLHRQAERARRLNPELYQALSTAAPAAARDIGNIAVIEDTGGVVVRRNAFDLQRRTVTFRPVLSNASRYRFETGGDTYDSAAAAAGVLLSGLGDDDAREIALPFSFPFFGATYQRLYLNSDGNLTFNEPDTASSDRSLGRMTAGAPRIAGLFRDLDPSAARQGVYVTPEPGRFTATWLEVPEYQEFGLGLPQTFQIRLYPDGRIELAFADVSSQSAVVGISPGGLAGTTSVVSFSDGSTEEYASTVAERFSGDNPEVDIVAAAQRFYETHEDSYDYLVLFNSLGVAAGSGAVAYEVTVRSTVTGNGTLPYDDGREFGSASRLQGVMNMGALGDYPTDPNAVDLRRFTSRDTPLTILGHEAGHLYLAFATVREPSNPDDLPMLGRQNAHWSFFYNSEASLLEGNRIQDNGEGAAFRFVTTGTVEGYSELDQYLMGFRPPEEVPPSFFVYPSGTTRSRGSTPQSGVQFNGRRRDVSINEIVQAEGRRTPDHTVAQRRFRFAFVLIVPKGVDPTSAELEKLENFRRQFETFYAKAAGGRAAADATLKRRMALSTFPAAGIVAGGSATATITLAQPAQAGFTVSIRTQNGVASAPALVTIPAGAASAGFTITGIKAGVEELTAEPSDSQYETAFSRIQVAASLAGLRLVLVSGGGQTAAGTSPLPQPVVFRVQDANNLPYPGLRVRAVATGSGTVSPADAVTAADGTVSFRWTPGVEAGALRAEIDGAGAASAALVTVRGRPAITADGAINAASFAPGLTPGALGSLFGLGLSDGRTAWGGSPLPERLAGTQLAINGQPAPLVYVSELQVNFLVPSTVPEGTASLAVSTPLGVSASVSVPVIAVSPGIFYNTATGFGAVLPSGSGVTTERQAAVRGGYVEIYATGLGPVQPSARLPGLQETVCSPQVFFGATLSPDVNFSGLAPGFLGLYQVNAQVPQSIPAGVGDLRLGVAGKQSNTVKVRVQ